MLRQIIQGSIGVSDPTLEDQVLDNSLKLVINCLNFDFIGTNPDESSEEVGTIQLPMRWRPLVEQPATLQVFFDLYRGCTRGTFQPSPRAAAAAAEAGVAPVGIRGSGASGDVGMSGVGAGAGAGSSTSAGGPGTAAVPTAPARQSITVRPARAAQALQCLTLFISVRRSIFSKESARTAFLLRTVTGICEIMADDLGFSDQDCYHEFCRLLGKLKATYQLSDLIRTPGYSNWIGLAAEFAMKSFRQMHLAPNSIHYILGLWSRLVSAAPHVSPDALAACSPMLGTYAPQVAFGYLEARLSMVEAVLKGQVDDDLEEDVVQQQLEQLPTVCRYKYEVLAKQVLATMDPLLQRLNEGLTLLHTSHDATVAQGVVVTEGAWRGGCDCVGTKLRMHARTHKWDVRVLPPLRFRGRGQSNLRGSCILSGPSLGGRACTSLRVGSAPTPTRAHRLVLWTQPTPCSLW